MVFNSIDQLEKHLMQKCRAAVAETEKEVHDKFKVNVDNFYSEFTPEEYIRTGNLRGSLQCSPVISSGNSVEAEVYFDTPSYEQGMMPLQHTPEHGRYGWATWSGEDVLVTALSTGMPHGGYAAGKPIWTIAMNELGGKKGIDDKLKAALVANGVPIG